jgi:hypothetical protein
MSTSVCSDPVLRRSFRYQHHFVAEKAASAGLQAADMLAWLCTGGEQPEHGLPACGSRPLGNYSMNGRAQKECPHRVRRHARQSRLSAVVSSARSGRLHRQPEPRNDQAGLVAGREVHGDRAAGVLDLDPAELVVADRAAVAVRAALRARPS